MKKVNLITIFNGTKSKTIQCTSQEEMFKTIQDANDQDLLYTVYEATVILTNVKAASEEGK